MSPVRPSIAARRLAPTLAVVAATLLLTAAAPRSAPGDEDATKVDRRLLQRLDPLDRALLDELIGFAPPAFAAHLRWHGGPAPTVEGLRGRVVVLQTWTTKNSARTLPARVARSLEDFDASDVQVIAIHTPEGADTAPTFLERRPQAMPVAVDPTGAYCDELGAYKRPVNIVVDRNGTVRYAGLKAEAVKRVVSSLVEEPFDPEATPKARDVRKPEPTGAWPPITGGVGSAADHRGKPAPKFHVAEWVRGRVDPSGRVAVVDFWATWCGPCIASIPHMNALADEFGDRIAFMGVSSESSGQFTSGMEKLQGRGITLDSFHYALALDPARRMSDALEIRGIPHVMVVSSDGIIRWQGHPTRLDGAVLKQILAADGGSAAADRRRYRWTR